MKNCVNCGAPLQDADQYCANCGTQQPVIAQPGDGFTQAQQPGADGQQNFQYNQQYQQQNQYQNQYQQPNQPYGYQPGYQPQKGMAIIAYVFGWLGLIIALLAGNKNDPFLKFHLNQALVLHLFSLLSFIPVIGWIWSIVVLVFWILGIIYAAQGEMKQVPLLGGIKILN